MASTPILNVLRHITFRALMAAMPLFIALPSVDAPLLAPDRPAGQPVRAQGHAAKAGHRRWAAC
jgi:hypothetical protein